MGEEYITLEGRVVNAVGGIRDTKSIGWRPSLISRSATFIELAVEINGETYNLALPGSWPLEIGNNIKLYFNQGYQLPETKEKQWGPPSLYPVKIEKMSGGEPVFTLPTKGLI